MVVVGKGKERSFTLPKDTGARRVNESITCPTSSGRASLPCMRFKIAYSVVEGMANVVYCPKSGLGS